MVTVTGKLMSSGRIKAYIPIEKEQYRLPAFIQSEFRDLREETKQLQITGAYLIERWVDCRDKISHLEDAVGNLNQQLLRILGILTAPRQSEASRALKAHPDNLANHLEPDHGRSGC